MDDAKARHQGRGRASVRGVSGGWDLFIHRVEQEVIERAFRDPARRAKIVHAALGEDAGILGAARVAFDLMA